MLKCAPFCRRRHPEIQKADLHNFSFSWFLLSWVEKWESQQEIYQFTALHSYQAVIFMVYILQRLSHQFSMHFCKNTRRKKYVLLISRVQGQHFLADVVGSALFQKNDPNPEAHEAHTTRASTQRDVDIPPTPPKKTRKRGCVTSCLGAALGTKMV